MSRRRAFLVTALVLVSYLIYSDPSDFSINAVPGVVIPIGSSSNVFNLGYTATISSGWSPAALTLPAGNGDFSFIPRLGFGYQYLPLVTSDAINTFTLSGGIVAAYQPINPLSISLYGDIGYYFWSPVGWTASTNSGQSFSIIGGLQIDWNISNAWALGIGGGYEYQHDLFNGVRLNLVARYTIPRNKKRSGYESIRPQPLGTGGLSQATIHLDTIYPVLYSSYDDIPFGAITLANDSGKDIKNVSVSFYLDRYMDNPMTCGVVFSLEKGESREVSLHALFTDDMMTLYEGTEVSAEILVRYDIGNESFFESTNPVIEIQDRNALVWDNNAKVSSFVTAKDPVVLTFSKGVMNRLEDLKNPVIDANFQKSMILFEAVRNYGMAYQIDPVTPYKEFYGNVTVIDFLQFPRQTLDYGTGDCDDLSVLFSALLESTGVETAFIPVPGHIFVAIALSTDPKDIEKVFIEPEDLIIRDDVVWLPLEVTLINEDFSTAWSAGAKTWREQKDRAETDFIRTREAWLTYKPVGFSEDGVIEPLDIDAVSDDFSRELRRFIDRQIFERVRYLEEKIKNGTNVVRNRNRLAVLFARFGLFEEALIQLDLIIAEVEDKSALINRGNIHYINRNYNLALEDYDFALILSPDNKGALLGSARCNYEMENYGMVKKKMATLNQIAPDLADRFAYLDLRNDDETRASNALENLYIVQWEDE